MGKNKGRNNGGFPGKPGGGAGRPQSQDDLAEAMRLQQAGNAAAAEEIYRRLLRKNPRNAHALLYLGTVFYGRRKYQEGLRHMEQAYEYGLRDESYYINAGLCHYNLRNDDKAIEFFREAIRLKPSLHEPYFNLGNCFYRQKRYEEAAEAFGKANELLPDHPLIMFQLACSLQDSRKYEESLPLFEKVLQKEPKNARANCAYAMSLLRVYRRDEGISFARRAIEAEPDNPTINYNFAHIMRAAGETLLAQQHFERAIALDPKCTEALLGLGRLFTDTGRFEESKQYFEKAMALDPNYYSGYASRGMSCMKNDALGAVEWFDKALAIKPDADDVLMLKGYALNILGRSIEAEKCLRRAIEINPKFAEHYQNLANILVVQGRVAESLEINRRAIELNPANHLVFSNILLYMHYLAQSQPEDLWLMHQNYGQMYSRRFTPSELPPYFNSRERTKRLRVGLVSSDLRRHSCAYFIDPLLRRHDRTQIEFYAYSNVKTPDLFTDSLRKNCAGWREIIQLSDQQAADLIHQDGIDILIDLGGHTADNRLPVFFYRPAPIQVSWLGYPNTTGMSQIDYRISDEFADPDGSEQFSAEKIIRLPGGFHCYGAFPDAPEVGPTPALENGYVTFGSFNNFAKVSDETAYLWCQILKNVPGSRLLIKSLGLDEPELQERVRARFASFGLEPERIEIIGKTPRISEHLRLYSRVDIALDTYPYNGTTTTCEALYMGVPVLSMRGATHASRVGKSLLSHVGLPDLATEDPEHFVGTAIALANNVPLLEQLRTSMRERLRASPLLDEHGFCRRFEQALRYMWNEFCARSPVAPERPPQPVAASNNISLNFVTAQPVGQSAPAITDMRLDFGTPAAQTTSPAPQASGITLNFNPPSAAPAQTAARQPQGGPTLDFAGAPTPKPEEPATGTEAAGKKPEQNSAGGMILKF